MKFSDFLREATDTVDLKIDKNATPSEIQQARIKAERNPRMVHRNQIARARADKQVAQSSTEPTKGIDMQIAQTEEKLASLRQRRAGMKNK